MPWDLIYKSIPGGEGFFTKKVLGDVAAADGTQKPPEVSAAQDPPVEPAAQQASQLDASIASSGEQTERNGGIR
jgi:hypothetical protein